MGAHAHRQADRHLRTNIFIRPAEADGRVDLMRLHHHYIFCATKSLRAAPC